MELGGPMDARLELDELFGATYDELRRLATHVLRRDGAATLNPTALVNEAYLKLAGSLRITPESNLHFKRIAARAMRQVLVEAARRRQAVKRGGQLAFVTLDGDAVALASRADDLIVLDEALERLRRLNARQAELVECRFFGGLEVAEVATVLQISESTVLRDWRAARAWLARELRSAADGS